MTWRKKETEFESVMRKYHPEIFKYCKAKLDGDAEAAKECADDVFVVLWKKWSRIDKKNNIRGWLYAVADKVTLKHRDKEAKRRSMMTDEAIPDIADPRQSLEEFSVLDCLSTQEKELMKRYYDPKSDRSAIAQELGISLNALHQRIHQLKNKVKMSMNGEC